MRVSRDQARENRKHVISAASALFREKGIDGVGIADVMGEVGLTHGGFYKQFASKADLIGEACACAVSNRERFWESYLVDAPDRRSAFVMAYLSERHCYDIADGCPLPALASEAFRQPDAVRRIFKDAIEALAALLADDAIGDATKKHERALSDLAQMVGAVLLARVSNDSEQSHEILNAARSRLLERN